MWENEFRYLTKAGAGLFEFDYLPSDKVYQGRSLQRQQQPPLVVLHWNHSVKIDGIRLTLNDYTKVSDPDYFNDFSSKYGSSTDGYATRNSARATSTRTSTPPCQRNSSVFNRESSNSYAAQPQLDVNYYQNDVGPFDTHLYGQGGALRQHQRQHAGSHARSLRADDQPAAV